jgi:hypothetical protein
VTATGAAVGDDVLTLEEDAPFHCHRHPDRETRVRCGRCDRPICSRCAMQGPVGFRCRECGSLAFDPLTSLTRSQMLVGFAASTALAAIAGFFASYVGFFGIIISFFAGTLTAAAVTRLIGDKHGRLMLSVVLGGILVGTLAGFGLEYGLWFAQLPDFGEVSDELGIDPLMFFWDAIVWTMVSVGAACVGAYTRLR